MWEHIFCWCSGTEHLGNMDRERDNSGAQSSSAAATHPKQQLALPDFKGNFVPTYGALALVPVSCPTSVHNQKAEGRQSEQLRRPSGSSSFSGRKPRKQQGPLMLADCPQLSGNVPSSSSREITTLGMAAISQPPRGGPRTWACNDPSSSDCDYLHMRFEESENDEGDDWISLLLNRFVNR